jgi:hypothetical protein
MTVSIELNRGLVAVIDDHDFDLIKKYTWHSHVHKSGHFYARTNFPVGKDGKRQKGVLMHRLIMGLTDPRIKCDHGDGDGRNNTRLNLRTCSTSQNGMNKGAQRNSLTGVKGVSPHGKNRFAATINIAGKQKHLGLFKTVEEAKDAYEKAAISHHGEFANCSGVKGTANAPPPDRKKYKGMLVFKGINKSGAEWAKDLGVSTSEIYRRLEKHGSIDDVIRNSNATAFNWAVQEATGIPTFAEG